VPNVKLTPEQIGFCEVYIFSRTTHYVQITKDIDGKHEQPKGAWMHLRLR
jgi:hypothetical protein